MAFELPYLPYAEDALEPHYSARTISFHYDKHHAGYVSKLNLLIEGTHLERMPLEEIIQTAAANPDQAGLFNNAAQVWNHIFFWHSMQPGGSQKPGGELAEKIDSAFGSFEKFADEFKEAAATHFGSGWGWLVLDSGELEVVTTANAETPITQGFVPLLTVDVWEHAYYLDYQNRLPDFLQVFLENLANWEFAAQNLSRAG
jgi:Fe-Mn family superoxide dismutase